MEPGNTRSRQRVAVDSRTTTTAPHCTLDLQPKRTISNRQTSKCSTNQKNTTQQLDRTKCESNQYHTAASPKLLDLTKLPLDDPGNDNPQRAKTEFELGTVPGPCTQCWNQSSSIGRLSFPPEVDTSDDAKLVSVTVMLGIRRGC